MKCVLDVCTALKWLLKETDSDKADDMRDQYRLQVHDLLAPDTFLTEAAHALTRAERKKIIIPGEAEVLSSDLLTTLPHFHAASSLLSRAIQLSSQLRIGAFDCLYLALAEREQCAIVTADLSPRQRSERASRRPSWEPAIAVARAPGFRRLAARDHQPHGDQSRRAPRTRSAHFLAFTCGACSLSLQSGRLYETSFRGFWKDPVFCRRFRSDPDSKQEESAKVMSLPNVTADELIQLLEAYGWRRMRLCGWVGTTQRNPKSDCSQIEPGGGAPPFHPLCSVN